MNRLLLLFLMLLSFNAYSQIGEGQKFCEESKGGSYFPVSLFNFHKKVFWYKNFYKETKEGTKNINGRTYIEFKQEWNNQQSVMMYLREENGVVYQYDSDSKKETVRFDTKFEVGHSWKAADGKDNYKIISYDGELRTPYCEYKNLLVIEAHISFGHFKFYYFKGHGYVGATKDDKLISCVSPE